MPVLHLEAPDLGFGFRWEPESKRLYIIHANGVTHEQVAAEVPTPEFAQLCAGLWSAGYRSCMRTGLRNPKVKHYQMLAERAKYNVKGPFDGW